MKNIKEELIYLAKNDPEGLCRPVAVVEFAKNPKTHLHKKFTWNIQKAAEEYWLWQARQVITLEFQVIKTSNGEKKTQLFVSLFDDRKAGGYRMITDVLKDKDLYLRLLSEALSELNRLKEKYKDLKELAGVFQKIDELSVV